MHSEKRVLLVDDDRDFVEMNKAVLEKQGYIVDSAFNGEEGLIKAMEFCPDLIILDVMMTTKNEGFNVTHELRNHSATEEIPILMLTAVNKEVPYHFEKDETWLPVDMFLEKPVSPAQLIEEVKILLENH